MPSLYPQHLLTVLRNQQSHCVSKEGLSLMHSRFLLSPYSDPTRINLTGSLSSRARAAAKPIPNNAFGCPYAVVVHLAK